MLIETLKTLFKRDLIRLQKEILAYQDEKIMWQVHGTVNNSAGNLCLHLVGNLNAFIGAVIGKTGYVRQRVLEFSLKNIPREELILKIEQTMVMIDEALSHLTQEELEKEYPLIVFKEKMSTEFFLVHLTTHLSYHLGQISYHRRLLDQKTV